MRAVTNFPVDAERFTARALLVPVPTRSVVVLDGERFAVVLDTNFPVLALRLTVRAMIGPFGVGEAQAGPPGCYLIRRVVVVTVTRTMTGLVLMRTRRTFAMSEPPLSALCLRRRAVP